MKLIKKYLRGNYFGSPVVPGTTPETSSTTYIDYWQTPEGQTKVKDIKRAAEEAERQEGILYLNATRDNQQLINNLVQLRLNNLAYQEYRDATLGAAMGSNLYNYSNTPQAAQGAGMIFNALMFGLDPKGMIRFTALNEAPKVFGATQTVTDYANKELNINPAVSSLALYGLGKKGVNPVLNPVTLFYRKNISIPVRNYRDVVSGRYAEGISRLYNQRQLKRQALEDQAHNLYSDIRKRYHDAPYGTHELLNLTADYTTPEGLEVFNFPYGGPKTYMFNYRYAPVNLKPLFLETPIEITTPEGTRVTGTHRLWVPSGVDNLWEVVDYLTPDLPEYGFEGFTTQIPTKLVDVSNKGGISISLGNDEAFTRALLEQLTKATQKTLMIPMGSTRLIAKNYVGGAPGDIEFLTTKLGIDENVLNKRFGFVKLRETAKGTGFAGSSPQLFSGTEGTGANVDINTLGDTGQLIHLLEATRLNNEALAQYYSNYARILNPLLEIQPSASLRIPKPGITISNMAEYNKLLKTHPEYFYTEQEYYQMLQDNPEIIELDIINNQFKSNKPKHVQRAASMIRNPQHVDITRRAIDTMYHLVEGALKLSERFPNIDWTNTATNAEFLKSIRFTAPNLEEIVSNPEMMKNIADYWYMRTTIGARSVNFNPNISSASLDEVLNATRAFDNGSGAGGGGNFILGNLFGGFTRTYTGYSLFHTRPQVLNPTLLDVVKALERESSLFRSYNNDEFVKAIEEANSKYGVNIDAASRDHFTDEVLRLVTEGTLTPKEADQYITDVANKLGISGFRGSSYNDYGNYFGNMRSAENLPHSIRNIDVLNLHNLPLLGAEFGSDNVLTLNVKNTKPYLMKPDNPEYRSIKNAEEFRLHRGPIINDLSDVFTPRVDAPYSYTLDPEITALRKLNTKRANILNLKDALDNIINRLYFGVSQLEGLYQRSLDTPPKVERLYKTRRIQKNLKDTGKLLGIASGVGTLFSIPIGFERHELAVSRELAKDPIYVDYTRQIAELEDRIELLTFEEKNRLREMRRYVYLKEDEISSKIKSKNPLVNWIYGIN